MTNKQRLAKLVRAEAELKATERGYTDNPNGPHWRTAMRLLDEVQASLAKPPVPQLGPLVEGGLSTMLMSPTHMTTGVDWTPKGDGLGVYVAFDAGFGAGGRKVLAVDALEVTRDSGAQGGDAFYATLACGIWVWYGHLDVAPPKGTRFRKGQVVGRIKHGPGQPPGGPHAHLGLDVRPLGIPSLKYGKYGNGPPYTFGSPTIGAQLAKALA